MNFSINAKCMLFIDATEENHQRVCVDGVIGPSLEYQFQRFVNEWMCTTDCKCYQGANGEIKDLWTGYGDNVLMPYTRNDIDTFEKDEFGTYTYPFIWTDDPKEGFSTFKDCYDKVIKP